MLAVFSGRNLGFPHFPGDKGSATRSEVNPNYAYSRETGARIFPVGLTKEVSPVFANHLRDCAYRQGDPDRPFRVGGLTSGIPGTRACDRCKKE